MLFDHRATVKFQAVPFVGAGGLIAKLPELRKLQPRLGGNYGPALQQLEAIHALYADKITVGVMLSDGRPGDSPASSVGHVHQMKKRIGSKLLVHSVMFGPDANGHGSCLEKIAETGGGTYHANDKLDAKALQTTFLRLSASVSTMRSSVLAFGENALKRIPEKQLEAQEEAPWSQPTEDQLSQSTASRKVRGRFVLPAKAAQEGEELKLERSEIERTAYLHKKPFAQGGQRYASHLWLVAFPGDVAMLIPVG